MYGKTLAATLLGLSALAAAQDTTTSAGPQPSQDGQVMVHAVWVGNANGDLVFEPESIQAKVGEMVQFQFYPRVCCDEDSAIWKPDANLRRTTP